VQILGIDFGFGFTKATDGERSLVVTSVVGEAEQRYLENVVDLPLDEDHIHLELDDRIVFVGDLATRQSSLRSFTLDQDRFVAESVRVLGLGVGSLLAAPEEPLKVVTGLPISTYREKREQVANELSGRHAFAAIDPAGRRRRVVLEIAEVRVLPQPFGTVYDLLLNDVGEIGSRDLLQEKVGVIDVGFQTSDFTVADRISFLERASGSTESGIGRAFSVIAGKVREKSGVSVELYRLYDAMQQGRIKVRGSTFDLGRLIEHVLTQLPRTWPPRRTASGPTSGTWTPSSSPAAAARSSPRTSRRSCAGGCSRSTPRATPASTTCAASSSTAGTSGPAAPRPRRTGARPPRATPRPPRRRWPSRAARPACGAAPSRTDQGLEPPGGRRPYRAPRRMMSAA
jgi:plasmid segregation protein ParM